MKAAAIGMNAVVDQINNERYSNFRKDVEVDLDKKNLERSEFHLSPLSEKEYLQMTRISFVSYPREFLATPMDELAKLLYKKKKIAVTAEKLEAIIRGKLQDDTYCRNNKLLTLKQFLNVLAMAIKE